MHLQSNLKYLSRYNTTLKYDLNNVDTGEVELLKVNNNFVFKLQDEEGKEFYSGSIYDPEYEANVFLDGVNFDNTGYVLLGINSNVTLTKILERKTDNAWVFVIEKDLRIIKKFLEETNLRPYLENKPERLIFFYGEEEQVKNLLSIYLQSLVGFYFLQTEILRTFPTYRVSPQYYQNVFEHFSDILKNHVFNIGNDLNDTLLGIKNELKNLKHVLTRPCLKALKDKYKGKPIICVSTGPSLDKQLPLLKQVKGKAVIICAESAMRVLLKNGISPDVVCILERIENSFKLSVEGVQIPQETVLAGLTVIDPRIFDYWPKYFIPIFKNNLANSRFINDAFDNLGELYCGNSVAHMCYMLANYIGGDPIIIIGQDLAYSDDGTTHSKDSFYNFENDQGIDDNIRTKIQESLLSEGMHNKTVYLDGYYGGKVRSRLLWQQFLIWYEHHVSSSRARTINATEGGVHIKGTERMPFKEAIENFCTEPITPITHLLEHIDMPKNYAREKLGNLREKYEQLKEVLQQIRDYAEENKEYTYQLLQELRPDSRNMFLLEMKLSRALSHNENVVKMILGNELISFYLRPLVAYMHVRINPISRINSIERAREILSTQGWFMENVVYGIDEFRSLYERELEEIWNIVVTERMED
ncbi:MULTISPECIES: 6-hydroxymethylpterin diphosphokinase MptE-like protein [unclassified Anoxybacillus]|uniref:motility associated factor glycosyltransferase family protein n=1 Tax=unclassified Anoxybacillus TaxID=2639704 RepID=UPI001EDAF9E1|nr:MULTISPECIES: 6-hydroxymethylpterin diphosphokinase MptE-like protein [unclassified Anoxybacillus]MCG3085218.1 DUF115 domain-containing protein [Anoxybacillus sp. LAT27]MCG5025022.1 DUF115 domain-containing protein [Anoxybacillus flavithermus]MCG6176153.1 DUF115 domain-containing protein [Anoxybacillus sp. LAT_31]MCG6179983.1 DUF115 domain-containing protein [Anoxybacillus sp. LAT_33]